MKAEPIAKTLELYPKIPTVIVIALHKYAEEGHPVGDFLQAVIANDFRDAVCRADVTNEKCLRDIANFIYNELPAGCHGSRRIYKLWMMKYSAKRKELGSELMKIREELTEAGRESNRFFRGYKGKHD